MKKQKILIYADAADFVKIKKMAQQEFIQGFTTNPSLMRKAGIQDYSEFAKKILPMAKEKPISFEIFSDEFSEVKRQAKILSSWGNNIYVKIPIVNSRGESLVQIIQELHKEGCKINVTAVLCETQVEALASILTNKTSSIVSIFAGRIADTGRDPSLTIKKAKKTFAGKEQIKVLWASVREVLNIKQAEEAGADIITVPPEILEKYETMMGMNLIELSRQTSAMFAKDAKDAGYFL